VVATDRFDGVDSSSWRIACNGATLAVANTAGERGSVESATSDSRSYTTTIDNATPRAANTPTVRPSRMNIVEPSVCSRADTSVRPLAADAPGDDDQIDV
jgi:hypothetical protein